MIAKELLKLLLILFLSIQSLVTYGEADGWSSSTTISFTPELEFLESKYGKNVAVLKGSDKPFTGLVSKVSSAWKDIIIKESFIEGYQSSGARTFHDKLTGEKLSGAIEAYYPNGLRHGVVNLINGRQDGVTTSWHPNGNLKSLSNYSMGVHQGEYSMFYKNGNKKQTGIDSPDGSIQWTDWNKNGHKETFYRYKSKNKSPISVKHWDSEGRKTGFWIEKYDDGSMKKEKFYSHGLPERRWTTWYDSGNKSTEANFAFGLLNGSFKSWNEKGVLVVSGDFKNSKEVRKWRFKDNDGNKIDRPKDLYFDITDDGKPIAIKGQNNKRGNMEAFYISVYMPLAIALLILLPLFGVGTCWMYRRFRDKKRNKVEV